MSEAVKEQTVQRLRRVLEIIQQEPMTQVQVKEHLGRCGNTISRDLGRLTAAGCLKREKVDRGLNAIGRNGTHFVYTATGRPYTPPEEVARVNIAPNYPLKHCQRCQALLQPYLITRENGEQYFEARTNYKKRKFCSNACSAKAQWNRPLEEA